MYEYGTLKPVEVVFIRGRGKRENSRGSEPNQRILHAYKEMSQ
jgi:hypothetical protein